MRGVVEETTPVNGIGNVSEAPAEETLPEPLLGQFLWHMEQQKLATQEQQQSQQLAAQAAQRQAGLQSFSQYLYEHGYKDCRIDPEGRVTRG